MHKTVLRLSTLLTAVLFVTGCAREISSNVYSADHVGEASRTFTGVVATARQVTVQENERLQDNGLGIIGGGIAGAYGGSYIGKGEGNTLATVGGALVG